MHAEKAIRDYLLFLTDPESMRDDAEIHRLEAAAREVSDPIEKLRLLSAAQRAGEVDGSHFEQAFIASAKSWASTEGVTPEAFKALGVPGHVLSAAGLVKGRKSTPRTTPKRQRAASVGYDVVMGLVPDGPFRIRDLMESSGASLQTVRKAVRSMLESGELRDLGLDPNWETRGRTPTLYEKIPASRALPSDYE